MLVLFESDFVREVEVGERDRYGRLDLLLVLRALVELAVTEGTPWIKIDSADDHQPISVLGVMHRSGDQPGQPEAEVADGACTPVRGGQRQGKLFVHGVADLPTHIDGYGPP